MDGGWNSRHDAEWQGASVSSLDGGDVANGIRPSHCEGGEDDTKPMCADVRRAVVDSLHAYCHLATSVAIKRERVDRFLQSKAYMNP